jgi:hypothetical protein
MESIYQTKQENFLSAAIEKVDKLLRAPRPVRVFFHSRTLRPS